MKKVGKTTISFRYDLNQIPYDYTVEVTNRFNRLDLIDKVPEELWMEVHDIVQEAGIKIIPKKKKCEKAKWLSEYVSYKAFLIHQCKETDENNGMGKTRDLFKKIRDTKGIFHAKMGTIKDRNDMDITETEDIKKRWQEFTGERK